LARAGSANHRGRCRRSVGGSLARLPCHGEAGSSPWNTGAGCDRHPLRRGLPSRSLGDRHRSRPPRCPTLAAGLNDKSSGAFPNRPIRWRHVEAWRTRLAWRVDPGRVELFERLRETLERRAPCPWDRCSGLARRGRPPLVQRKATITSGAAKTRPYERSPTCVRISTSTRSLSLSASMLTDRRGEEPDSGVELAGRSPGRPTGELAKRVASISQHDSEGVEFYGCDSNLGCERDGRIQPEAVSVMIPAGSIPTWHVHVTFASILEEGRAQWPYTHI
jgi:hypothetical protein